jgi:hypothetical protein
MSYSGIKFPVAAEINVGSRKKKLLLLLPG